LKSAGAAIALADTDGIISDIRQRLRVLEWAVGANTVMLVTWSCRREMIGLFAASAPLAEHDLDLSHRPEAH
jgi:hypothetical protein